LATWKIYTPEGIREYFIPDDAYSIIVKKIMNGQKVWTRKDKKEEDAKS